MIKAELKGIDCADLPDPRSWVPPSRKSVYVALTLSIGVRGSTGADLFQIVVVTPQALQAHSKRKKTDTKLLVVQRYDWSKIETTLRRWIAEAEGVSWEQITDQLRKRFHWEYEGMGPPGVGASRIKPKKRRR